MANREFEQAISDEVANFTGASVTFEQGGKHPQAKLVFDGFIQKVSFSGTPSDRFALKKALADIRRKLRTMGATREKPETDDEDEAATERVYHKPNDGAAKRLHVVQNDPVEREEQPDIIDQLIESGLAKREQGAPDKAPAQSMISGRIERIMETKNPLLEALRVPHDPNVNRSGWGLYTDIDAIDYHMDPCPEPSISNSLMDPILKKTPLDFAFGHPRRHELLHGMELDPLIRKTTAAMVMGDVVHQLALGKGNGYAIGDFPTWASGDAKTFKLAAENDGLTPIKRKDFEEAEPLAARIKEAIRRALDGAAYETEVVFMYQEQTHHGPVWVRGMMDVWCAERAIILDPKVTKRLYDGVVERQALDMAWDRQGALYERAIGQIFPELAGRVEFSDLMINPDAPYVSRLWAPEKHWLASSVRQCLMAFERFGECMFRKEWPAFGNQRTRGPMPTWEDKRREEMEIGGS